MPKKPTKEREKARPLPEKARFTFVTPADYKFVYANGVYGGISPRGDLICHFFIEYAPVPSEEVATVTPTGGVIPQPKEEKEAQLRREMQVGLILKPDQAESIAKWMLNHVDKFKSSKRVNSG